METKPKPCLLPQVAPGDHKIVSGHCGLDLLKSGAGLEIHGTNAPIYHDANQILFIV